MGTQPGSEPPFRVTPAPGSRLEELLNQRDAAIAMATEAANRAKAVVDAIKAEAAAVAVSQRPPGAPIPQVIEIAGSPHRPELVQRWVVPVVFDSKQLKKDDLVAYARYAKYGKGHWRLEAAT